jgi:soluble lytic murein transglycosylase-like protein
MGSLDAAIAAINLGVNESRERRARFASMAKQRLATTQQATPPAQREAVGSVGRVRSSGSVDNWIHQALDVMGVPADQRRINALKLIIQKESSGNPRAINNWDSNAKRGDPSRGLMQTIGSTFNRWKLPGYDNIYDPVANIIAGYRYATSRYGDVLNVPGVKSTMKGGAYRPY